MEKHIDKISNLMQKVASGELRIQDVNEGYIKEYQELDDLLYEKGIENPNRFSDLWEFYEFWKTTLPHKSERQKYVLQMYKELKRKLKKDTKITKRGKTDYISKQRLKELEKIKSNKFDLSKLIRLCEEINSNFSQKNYFSVGVLIRTLIDHVPPIFGKKLFSEVINNYGSSNKAFRQSMSHLGNSSRKIADAHLHTPVRKKEVLPTSNQVDFSNDIDVLLGEIVRVLK